MANSFINKKVDLTSTSEVLKVTAATANRLHVVISALEIKPRETIT